MNKLILVLALISTNVTAIDSYDTRDGIGFVTGYKLICIDNVKYISGIKKLTIWINPRTLKPENCK